MQKRIIILLFILFPAVALANSMQVQVSKIEENWIDTAEEKVDADIKENFFLSLIEDISRVITSFPASAEPLIIKSAILLSMADDASSFSALKLVKQAKILLEQAIEINPEARDGSALVTMGILYYKVPGWPIGFGDDDEAELFLLKALDLNSESVTNNFFYADFLLEQGKDEEALRYLNKAVDAKLDPNNVSFRIKKRHQAKAQLALAQLTN